MRANIVSTDLAVYFSRKQKLTELITSGQLDISDKPQRRMIRGLLMNVCDLMAMTLPFRQSMRVVDCVMEEFFCQGDREKAQGLPPSSELMDRDKMSSIPRMQIGFLNNVFMPIYNLVSAPNVLPRTAELVGLAKRTISKWERWVSLGAGYSMGCEVPWSAEEEEEEEKLEAEQIRAHWQRMDEEDLRERKEEEQRQFMAAQVRRQSIAAVNIDALRRTSVKAMPTLGRPGGRKSSGGSDKMLGADLVPLVTKLP